MMSSSSADDYASSSSSSNGKGDGGGSGSGSKEPTASSSSSTARPGRPPASSASAAAAAVAGAGAAVEDDSNDDDPFAVVRNKNNRRDQVVSALSGCGGIKVTACTVRNLLNEAMQKHDLTPVPADALGRTMICALLLADGIQKEQIVQITMNGDGPIRGIVAICNGRGEIRGYVGSPRLFEGQRQGASAALLADAVGRSGTVQMVKNHPDWPRPYNGITAIRHGDIDRDIGIYLAESEQRSCALAASTTVDGVLCKAAGGYIVEQLPGVDPETLRRVEANLASLVEWNNNERIGGGGGTKTTASTDGTVPEARSSRPLPAHLLLRAVTPVDLCEHILQGLDMQLLLPDDDNDDDDEPAVNEPKLVCTCTSDRLLRSLRLLPREEVEEILVQQERIEARCQFCGKVYRMGPEEVRRRLDEQQEQRKQ